MRPPLLREASCIDLQVRESPCSVTQSLCLFPAVCWMEHATRVLRTTEIQGPQPMQLILATRFHYRYCQVALPGHWPASPLPSAEYIISTCEHTFARVHTHIKHTQTTHTRHIFILAHACSSRSKRTFADPSPCGLLLRWDLISVADCSGSPTDHTQSSHYIPLHYIALHCITILPSCSFIMSSMDCR